MSTKDRARPDDHFIVAHDLHLGARSQQTRKPRRATPERMARIAAKHGASLDIDPATGRMTMTPNAKPNGHAHVETADDLRDLI